MTIHVLSPSRHSNLRWRFDPSYAFAANRNLVGLAAAEVGRAAVSLPLAFVCQQGNWTLCALLGLMPGENLYVGSEGQWIASYVPASLRGHPFSLGWEGKDATLCVDEGSGLLLADGSGEPFFNETGGLSEPVAQVWTFLSTTAESILLLEAACSLLAKTGVFEEWPITVQRSDSTHTVSGLHRINEAALARLDDNAFGELRKSGVLGIVYAQLLSMSNLSDLGRLGQMRAEADAAERARAEVKPMIMLPEDSSIDWDWSKIGKS